MLWPQIVASYKNARITLYSRAGRFSLYAPVPFASYCFLPKQSDDVTASE